MIAIIHLVILLCSLSLAAARFDTINDYLDFWYSDPNRRGFTIEEGEQDPSDLTRNCPPRVYFTNRLLCYSYWRYVKDEHSRNDFVPVGLIRDYLEAQDKERRGFSVTLYGGGTGRQMQDDVSPGVTTFRAGRQNSRNSRIMLHTGHQRAGGNIQVLHDESRSLSQGSSRPVAQQAPGNSGGRNKKVNMYSG